MIREIEDRPPFGEYRQMRCRDCGAVEREWWRAGDGPFEPIGADRHRHPQPDACPVCGGQLEEVRALVDPAKSNVAKPDDGEEA